MFIRWILAALHLLALGIGLGAVWARGRALREPLDAAGLRRVFHADAWWGAAGAIWIVSGLLRAFAGLEKGSAYYLHNHLFWTKMGLLIVLLALEVAPAIGLMRWRMRVKNGAQLDTAAAHRFATFSFVQVVLIVLMALVASAMARGFGTPGA